MKLEGWIAYWEGDMGWIGNDVEGELDEQIKQIMKKDKGLVFPIKQKITITIPPGGEEEKDG